ncbi:Pre-mRNA splicing Prp18-interacting factor-domain-containing protein [Chytriomyces cf. hyalinus JEL632]|nr:Pre-mRNA splicing Prp18-interacting factor-domain-containing protein [Chytriomyces cf. hyalinus JEL632]
MSGANNTPLGTKGGDLPSAGQVKLSREEFKRQKVIEEQRKAGTIPAEVDPETGKDINPHIPQYISSAPWYLDINHATLKHQRNPKEGTDRDDMNTWYQRGVFKDTSVVAKKFRKGACENCGAMSHKTRDCVDRPRAKSAKQTNKTLAPDEHVSSLSLGFDAKRDRWNGYDPNDHSKVIQDWELVDAERRRIREEEAQKNLNEAAAGGDTAGDGAISSILAGSSSSKPSTGALTAEEKERLEKKQLLAILDDEDEGEKDEDIYADAADQIGQKLDTKSRTTVRNLRIREDTAKYLLNLDVNSAHYDPKTRSMRDNPNKEKDPNQLQYAGDNFVRWTGDAPKMAQLQMFAWQSEAERTAASQIHLQANPTMGEILFKEHQQKKEAVAEVKKGSVLERYGGEEYLQAPPKELLLAQTENYVEYSQSGKIIKGQEKATIRSKYEEDVCPQNHTSVWGSWWNAGQWGYACCHSFSRNSYCTGQAGIDAANAAAKLMQDAVAKAGTGQAASSISNPSAATSKTLYESHILKVAKDLTGKDSSTSKRQSHQPSKLGTGASRLGEGEIVLDEEKLKKAKEQEEARLKRHADGDSDDEDGGKARKSRKKYNSLEGTTNVTEEELEAYRMKKTGFDDPMAKYVDSEDE